MALRNLLLVFACGAIPLGASATNANFQAHFFDVCGNPSGALAARCAQTTGGLGDLSGDSESSLNPSQSLSAGDRGLAAAHAAREKARDRADRKRAGRSDEDSVVIGPFSLLISAHGSFVESDKRVDMDSEREYDADVYSAELGFDYRVDERFVVGLLGMWESADTEFVRENAGVNFAPLEDAGQIDSDRSGFMAFGSFAPSPESVLEISAGYLFANHEVSRNSVFQESTRSVPQTSSRVAADVDGKEAFVALYFGYSKDWGSWTWGPYAGVTYALSEVDAYRETDLSGAGLALAVDDYERESLLGTAGVRVGRGISLTNGLLLPQLRVEYAHEFRRDPEALNSTFLLDIDQNVLRLEGDHPDRDYFTLGAGLALALPHGWMPFIDYQTTVGHDDFDQWRITAGLRREL